MAENHVLDNMAWHALNTHYAHFAIGSGLAKRFPPDIGSVSALAEYSEAAYHDLAQIVGDTEGTALFAADLPPTISGWKITATYHLHQLVCQQPVADLKIPAEVVELIAADVSDIMQLVDAARPGPFFERTIETGRYFGIRQDGKLVAMAGQRLRLPGYGEVGLVCTHPDWRGKGYARLLSSILINLIWEQNEVPYLHVFPDNEVAYHLYESLHFVKRREMIAYAIKRMRDLA
jgi:predicted GNAT family acetyltransferase